jgi:hypothetical protein
MSDVPEARERLLELADQLEQPLLFPVPVAEIAAQIRHVVDTMLHKEPWATHAPRVSRSVTPEVKAAIFRIHAEFPRMTQEQIGHRVGVAGGRVSEVLNGKR